MTLPNRPLRRDTRVFISATSRELGSARLLVEKALKTNDYHAVEMTTFAPDYRDLTDKLRMRTSTEGLWLLTGATSPRTTRTLGGCPVTAMWRPPGATRTLKRIGLHS